MGLHDARESKCSGCGAPPKADTEMLYECRSYHHESGKMIYSHCCLKRQLKLLQSDQVDWRRGVELIASALGEKNPTNLCCVRIADIALNLRAKLEEYEK